MRESWRIGGPGATFFFAVAGCSMMRPWTSIPRSSPATTRISITMPRVARPRRGCVRRVGEQFDTQLGRWHDDAVGPHPISMFQVAFPASEFPKVVPWLMLNRQGLRILVHPETGNGYRDHAVYPLWLGEPVPLRFEVLRGER